MSALDTNTLEFLEKPLHVPTLEEIKNVLQSALKENFKYVDVQIVCCPNLKEKPFKLAASGLGGHPTLIEVGGAPYLLPLVDRTKIYNMKEIVQKSFCNSVGTELMAIGAGAGPYMLYDTNCEAVYNVNIDILDNLNSEGYTGRWVGADEKLTVARYPKCESRFALLANIFASEGKTGKVLRVHCCKRIGNLDYIASIRLALTKHFVDKCVGLGGVFLIKNGSVKQHVMRDFSKTAIYTEDELNQWLKYVNMPGPLTACGTLVTNEHDLDLRLQHFHSFGDGWVGHYHYDVTPETIEYEGYFEIGEKIVRVDKPAITHHFGRD